MKTFIIMTGIIGALSLSSCNTISGMGKDVEAVGGGIDTAAQKTSNAIDEAAARN